MFRINKNHKRIVALFVWLISIFPSLRAQMGNDSIALDPEVVTGKLPNGFTYYIKKEDQVKGKFDIYFVVKAASNQEAENQVEMAHLLEHMVFKGTKHFNHPHAHFEQFGLRWGTDINANTGLDETLYLLRNLAFTNKKQIKDALLFMHDISHDLLLDSMAIEKERYVVWNELQSSNYSSFLMRDDYMDDVVGNPGYHYTKMKTRSTWMKNGFNHLSLSQYYNDWYWADNQAIVIVGDIDPQQMKQQICSLFADLLPSPKPYNRKKYPAFQWKKSQVIIKTNPQIRKTEMKVIMKQLIKSKTVKDDFLFYTMAAVIDNMVQKRLAILEESTSPFSSARSRFVNPYEATGPRFDAFEEYFEIKRNRTQEAVKVALTEIERINRYGFTQEELTSSIAQLSKKIHDASPSLLDIGRRYIAHFVHGEIYPGLQEETLLQQKILADIRLDQINQLAKNIFGENSCDILILAPEQSDVMTEDEMRQLQMGVRNIDLQPYKIPKSDLFSNSDSLIHNIQLLSKPVAPGDWIITKKNIAAIGITELTLSNGSLILLKPLKNKEEKNGIITIHAFKKGGYSAYKTVDQLSAMVAPIAVIRSGIVGLNRTDLKELDNKYGFKVNVYMDKSEEHIIATCRAEHFELLLKLIYLYLKYPKLDLETFNETARSFKEMPNDTVTLSEGLYNKLNAVWNTRIDVPKGYKADLQTGLNIYKDHFSNVSGFNFVIVGNFDTTYAIPLLNRYIGSLDGKVQPINETLQKHSSNNKSKLNTRKIVYTEKGKRLAQINMCFGSSCELNLKNNLILNLLSSTLKDVLLNRIRDKEGATYALTTFIRTKGNQDLTIEIVFDCAPEVAELMADYVLQEIDKLKNNELNTQALAKMKILETERLNRELTTSSFWEEYIKHQKRYNYPLNEIENARWVISKITSKELQAAAVKYLSIDRHFELINLPK